MLIMQVVLQLFHQLHQQVEEVVDKLTMMLETMAVLVEEAQEDLVLTQEVVITLLYLRLKEILVVQQLPLQ